VLYLCNITVTDGVFFYIILIMNLLFDYRDMMITRLNVYWCELGGLKKNKKN
jgi:hypothetical protein